MITRSIKTLKKEHSRAALLLEFQKETMGALTFKTVSRDQIVQSEFCDLYDRADQISQEMHTIQDELNSQNELNESFNESKERQAQLKAEIKEQEQNLALIHEELGHEILTLSQEIPFIDQKIQSACEKIENKNLQPAKKNGWKAQFNTKISFAIVRDSPYTKLCKLCFASIDEDSIGLERLLLLENFSKIKEQQTLLANKKTDLQVLGDDLKQKKQTLHKIEITTVKNRYKASEKLLRNTNIKIGQWVLTHAEDDDQDLIKIFENEECSRQLNLLRANNLEFLGIDRTIKVEELKLQIDSLKNKESILAKKAAQISSEKKQLTKELKRKQQQLQEM